MQIDNNDISSIEPFGLLDGRPVSLIRTKGGLCLATMTDKYGAESVLGAASHQAILCHSVETRFSNFQPMIMKSEGLRLKAESHSHFLSDDLRKSGHDIFSVQNGNDIEFYVTKQNIRVGVEATSEIVGRTLMINHLMLSPEFSEAFAGAVSEKALTVGLSNVKWDD